ncbi:MAG: cellulase family glycosylhydrolase [Candidatus Methanomethylicaceae archaeon]
MLKFPSRFSARLLLILLLLLFIASGCSSKIHDESAFSESLNDKPISTEEIIKLGDEDLGIFKREISGAPSTSGIKGVNNPHIWYDSQAYSALDTIKSYGFNTVRIVWETRGSGSRLKQIIDRCKQLGLKPIPELHDVTGSTSTSDLDRMVTWWINNKSYIASDVWINIANEWGPSNSTTWRDAYKNAVSRLRGAGINNILVIDSGGWGQDDQDILKYASEILNSDPLKNVVFSIHMYGMWNDNNKINNFLTTCKNNGIPILVGEFGYNYNNGNNNLGCKVDAVYLMKRCRELGIGFIAWSWTGNNSENAWLDMTYPSDWRTLTYWGQMVVNEKDPGSGVTIKYNFEGSIEGWSGVNIAGGPWYTNEWAYSGSYSLKADVDLSSGKQIYLCKVANDNLSGKSRLKAVVRHATWGNQGTGMIAKLYIKVGSNWQWYDGGSVNINSSTAGTILTLNLSGISGLDYVREIGVQFIAGQNSSGRSAVYVDYVTVE